MKKLYCFLIAFLVLFVYSCANSRFTNPSQYIRYAGQVNGGGSGDVGNNIVYKILTINVYGDGYVLIGDNKEKYVSEIKFVENSKVKIEARAENGSAFQAWRGSISSENPAQEIIMDKDITLVASFVLPTEKKILFINIGKNGSVEINGVLHENDTGSVYKTIEKTCVKGEIVSLRAIPKDAFIFSGWSGSIESVDDMVEIIVDDISTVSASFNPDQKVLAISITPNYGEIFISIGGGTAQKYTDFMYIQKGSKVKIEAKPIDGRKYKFVKWTGSTNSAQTSIDIPSFDTDMSFIAEFEQVMKTLTITINDSLFGYVTVNGITYEAPIKMPIDTANITVLATRLKTYAFDKWSGSSNSSARQITLTLDDDKTLNASFIDAFATYSSTIQNGYNASIFDTWILDVSDFGSKEIPNYDFNTYAERYENLGNIFRPNWQWVKYPFTWNIINTVDLGSTKVTEYSYVGKNSKAMGFGISSMNYYLYKGINYYMKRDEKNIDPNSPHADYNKGEHADRLKRFYFYRFTGKPLAGNLNNALCAVDTYTKLIYGYAIPTVFGELLGQQVPSRWDAVETQGGEGLKFYEYPPIGFVKSDGDVVLFETFKKLQGDASGSGNKQLYMPKSIPGAILELDITKLDENSVIRSPYY